MFVIKVIDTKRLAALSARPVSHLDALKSHITDVLTQTSAPTKTTSELNRHGLLERLLSDTCRELERPNTYAQRLLSCEFSAEPITPFSVADVFRDTDVLLEVCDEARRRLAVAEWTGSSKGLTSELRKELQARADLCRENLEQKLRVVSDPRAILTMFHYSPEIRATIHHMNLVLGITPEQCGGEIERHDASEFTKFREGGWMYQASDLHLIKSVFSLLRVKTGASFFDLGSGYGHPVLYGANLRPDIQFTGIELMPARVEFCRSVAHRLQLSNARFEAADATVADLSTADVIFLFNPFPPSARREVTSKLISLAEARPVVVIDYEGLITQQHSAFRRMDKGQVAPFYIYGAREHFEGSLALAGLSTEGPRV